MNKKVSSESVVEDIRRTKHIQSENGGKFYWRKAKVDQVGDELA